MDKSIVPEEENVGIELPENISDGLYANMTIVNHSPMEFVIDFISLMPGVPKPRVRSRMILSPRESKRFSQLLIKSLRDYEKSYGKIYEVDPLPVNFGPSQGEA